MSEDFSEFVGRGFRRYKNNENLMLLQSEENVWSDGEGSLDSDFCADQMAVFFYVKLN